MSPCYFPVITPEQLKEAFEEHDLVSSRQSLPTFLRNKYGQQKKAESDPRDAALQKIYQEQELLHEYHARRYQLAGSGRYIKQYEYEQLKSEFRAKGLKI